MREKSKTKICTRNKKKNSILRVRLETFDPSRLDNRSWMRWYDTCTGVSTVSVMLVSLVCLASCQNSPQEWQSESQVKCQMSSKTILIGLSIFRCGGEKSIHGRPSYELIPYDCRSRNTEDFAAWCKLVSKGWCFNDRAGECGVVWFTTHFFYFWTRPKNSLLK